MNRSLRLAVAACVGATLIGGGVSAAATAGTPSTTKTIEPIPGIVIADKCKAQPHAGAVYQTSAGHAVSGRWTMSPEVKCDQVKQKIVISSTLRRNGVAQLSSGGSCDAKLLRQYCKKASGPTVSKSYGTSIRGTWDVVTNLTVQSLDGLVYRLIRPRDCTYNLLTFTTKCTFVSESVVIP